MNFDTNLGGSIASKNIIYNEGKIKWCIRETPVNDEDNGWRFLSDIDTEEFLSDSSNMIVCRFETLINIEPAIIDIFNMPTGTEVMLIHENGKKRFIDVHNTI